MTEGKKALNSSVSTLKKNPGRLSRLVKAAKLLIVPPSQYTSGKAKKLVDEAIKKLKTKRGLNGVTGESAGPFADKALQKTAEKTMSDKDHRVAGALGALAGSTLQKKAGVKKDVAVGSAAVASGAAIGGVLAHDRAKASTATRTAIKNNARGLTGTVESRLARSAKVQSRMVKPLRRAGIKGALAGAAIGAGAAIMKKSLTKEAGAILNSRTVKQRADQAFKYFKGKDVTAAKVKSVAKKGAIAGAVIGGGAIVTKKNNELKKQAELVLKNGKKYREGTVGSAASKVGSANAVLSALGKGSAKNVVRSAVNGALLGGAYGTVRGANRLRKGEISLTAKEMKDKKK